MSKYVPLLSLMIASLCALVTAQDADYQVELPEREKDGKLILKPALASVIERARVPAKEAGVLLGLDVKEGALVSKAQELGHMEADLAVIDQHIARLEFAVASLQSENQVDLLFAQASLKVAEKELQRSRDAVNLYARSISKTELDRLELIVERSKLQIEQAKRDLEVAGLTKDAREQGSRAAEKHLDNRTILAPQAGMVVEVFIHSGEWLNPGDPVVRIIRLDRLRIEALVTAEKYGREQLMGRRVRFTTKLPPDQNEADFEGEVVFVHPELEDVTSGRGKVWAEVDNPDLRLRPGATGTLTIMLD